MPLKLTTLALITVLSSQSVFAQVAGHIKGAQFPGWIERDGQMMAIKPGQLIEEGDLIRTGAGGKVLVSMNEGSDVKLGNNSKIEIKTVKPTEVNNDNVFGLALNVLKGVFRFTTSVLGKAKKRDVSVTFGSVTAGIRGTDIWGRVNEEKDLVCLIEGKIDVSHPDTKTVRLDQPRQYYDAAKNSAGALKGKVEQQQLDIWADLTELDKSQGVMTQEGHWSVVLMSLEDAKYAQVFSDNLNQKGYPSEVIDTKLGDKTYHRVVIKQFNAYDDALNAQKRLSVINGVNGSWIKRYSF